MVALADTLEGWAMDKRMTPVQSAKLLGWAESLRQLAELVGPDWNPPEPQRLTLMGFLGRQVLGEDCANTPYGTLVSLRATLTDAEQEVGRLHVQLR